MKTLEMKNAISKIKKLKRWAYQKIEGIPQKITNSKNRSIECINSEETIKEQTKLIEFNKFINIKNNIKQLNICVIRISEEEEHIIVGKFFENVVDENFRSLI